MSTPASHDDEMLPADLSQIAARAACEGIPVAAIARLLAHPLSQVYATLNMHLLCGAIAEVPRPDWPPTARHSDRLPSHEPRPMSYEALMFTVQRMFKLTKLEAGFLATLLRNAHADKAMLHGIIEQQRMQRSVRPDTTETTDPKMVDVMICKLRKKLVAVYPGWAAAISTVWGGGYFIAPDYKTAIMQRISGEHDASSTH